MGSKSRRRQVLTVGVLVVVIALAGGGSLRAAPANDDFASAQVFTAAGGTLAADNTGATTQVGEPDNAGDRGGASLWYSWTPDFNGTASIDTTGSSIDTLLSAYTGSSLATLTRVASNDDSGDSVATSRICFPVTANTTTYKIAVDGYDGAVGPITLHWGQKADSAPCPVTPPTISGPVQLKVGDQLTRLGGDFVDGGGTESFQWYRCVEEECAAIAGATGSSYVVGPRDVGTAIRLDVKMTNPGGSALNTSDPTAVVATTPQAHTNGRIFWVTNRTAPGVFDIHSMFGDKSNELRLTPSGSSTTEPAPSPDGTKVAFVDIPSGRISVMNADGSGVVPLTVTGTYPTWSPDGSRLAYVNTSGIHVVDLGDPTDDVLLVPIPAGQTRGSIDWSPDGTKIAFGYSPTAIGPLAIAVVRADGRGSITSLTSPASADDENPAWSPDGSRIAFDRITGSTDGDLYVMNADGTNQTQLFDGNANDIAEFGVDWSPDGTSILFTRFGLGDSNLFTIPAAGGSVTQLTTDTHRDELAAWGVLPAVPPAGGGGGGGGGGAGGSPNLNVSISGPASATAGSSASLAVTINNKGGGSSSSTLQLALTNATFVSARADRGPGCTASGASVNCPLDFFPGGLTAGVNVTIQVGSLPVSVKATVVSSPEDSDHSDDSSTWSVQAPTPPTTSGGSKPTPAPVPVALHRITGTNRADHLIGTAGADTINGLGGADSIYGGKGNDTLNGGGGNDTIVGGPGHDTIFGGPGSDLINARDRTSDTIDCGTGRDLVYADKSDKIARNCEEVHR